MTFPGMLSLIERKKEGKSLDESMIRGWVTGIVDRTIPDYQTSALLMAIRLIGMDFEETLHLTQAMAESGDRLRFDGYPLLADKHSTGGVGDKVTLVLAPMVAACGLPVSMLSGRGLGFSGGTIDKFEALEGVSCLRDGREMQAMLDQVGWANAQASQSIAPADRILYALRDVTGTVDSIPLITASILSKKLSGGTTHLCLDVKAGKAAFMQDLTAGRALAENLRRIGEMGGLKITGFVTRMEEPLGHAIGNYLELMESVAYLRQPPTTPLMALCFALAERMLTSTGLCADSSAARLRLQQALAEGAALEKLLAYLRFNGAHAEAVEGLLAARYDQFPRRAIRAPHAGHVTAIDGRALGVLGVRLGAGRQKADDLIDPMAGFLLAAQVGDQVAAGDALIWAYGDKAAAYEELEAQVLPAYRIESRSSEDHELLLHRF